MEKTTLKKIIRAVRDLEVKKSVNDLQFEFYNKKKHRIERKERRMAGVSCVCFSNTLKLRQD